MVLYYTIYNITVLYQNIMYTDNVIIPSNSMYQYQVITQQTERRTQTKQDSDMSGHFLSGDYTNN